MTIAKRLVIGALVLLALLAVALVLLITLVDLNRFKPLIEQRVTAMTGRTLMIDGDIGWRLYPVLGADLRAVSLGNAPGFAGPMAQIERAALGVALLPLLRGELQVSEVVLERPALSLAIAADGRNNWDDLVTALEADAPTAPEPTADDASSEDSLAIAIEGVRVTDAAVSWSDATSGQQLRLAPLNLRTGALGGGKPAPVEVALALVSNDPALEIVDLQLSATIDVAADFSSARWEALELTGSLRGADLPTGAVEMHLRGDGSVDLDQQQLALPGLQLELAIAEAADNAVVGPVQLDLSGDIAVDLARTAITLQALAMDARLLPGRTGVPREPVELALRTAGTIDLESQTLSLPQLTLTADGLTLTGGLTGRQIIDAPTLAGDLDLAPVALRALLAQWGIEPPATTDPQVLSQLALSARFAVSPTAVTLTDLQARLDDTTLSGRLSATLDDITSLAFALTLDSLDIDRYLPPATGDETASPDTPPAPPPSRDPAPAPPATEDPFAWMDGLAIDGTLKAGQLKVMALALRDVAATVALRDRVLTAEPVSALLYGGEQQVALRLDARQAEPETRLKVNLQSVALGDLLGDLMEKAPLRGTAAVTADLQLRGLEAPRIKQTLSGSGQLSIRDGAIQGINVAQELRNAIALFKGQPRTEAVAATDFTEMTLQFTADQGVISWPSLAAQSPLLRLASSGKIDLGADTLRARIDANVVKTLKGQGGEPLAELAGFNVPIELRGSLDDPKVRIDIKDVLLQTQLGDKQRELEQKAEVRKDELRGKAAEELQRGLNRLLRPRDGRAAGQEPAGTPAPADSQ